MSFHAHCLHSLHQESANSTMGQEQSRLEIGLGRGVKLQEQVAGRCWLLS